MAQRVRTLVFFLISGLFAALGSPANAHPHVWVTMKSEVVYGPDGSVTGIRHAWTFDDMFSAFATQGIDTKKKGVFTREELAPLAEVNITSLKEFEFFTNAKVDGKKTVFTDPVDYFLEYQGNMLTLNFLLPLKTPVKAQDLQFSIYDPAYFVDLSFAETDPVTLKGAPVACKLAVIRPVDPSITGQQAGEAFFKSLPSANEYGAQFANKIAVTCP
jgi:ABC-type uncharacterized transport system substrate-binding protein